LLPYKNILVIRADNLGDLLMSSPAIRALKQTFQSNITVLTSAMATGIAKLIPEVDDVITYDLPWVKSNDPVAANTIFDIVETIKQRRFDAAFIFTVFSQNPLPAAMLAYMAQIPVRVAYCRENPYELLTHWLPDKEPYTFIQHQVTRDLKLVEKVGATTNDERLSLTVPEDAWIRVKSKLTDLKIGLNKPWIIFHAGVSEKKREYPQAMWVEAAKTFIDEYGYQVLFTGSSSEKALTDELAMQTGGGSFSLGGVARLDEFIALVANAPVVVSVNTGTIHIAAAVNTPVVVLYAQTNPQHTPWMVPYKVLEYEVPEELRSKNEVIQHLYKTVYTEETTFPSANDIVTATLELLQTRQKQLHENLSSELIAK
jgi:lipopolysaccharide heptosyltransferase II